MSVRFAYPLRPLVAILAVTMTFVALACGGEEEAAAVVVRQQALLEPVGDEVEAAALNGCVDERDPASDHQILVAVCE